MTAEVRTQRLSDRFKRPPYMMIIAEHPTGEVAGFIDFGPPEIDVGRDVQIYSFYFLKQFQRLGIGKRLFAHCLEQIRQDGHRSMCLDALAISPYRGFYEKMGGKVIGHDIHKLGEEDFETVIYGWDDLK